MKSPKFAYTRQTSCLLESIAGCVLNDEPVLLVGETGTGKTSTVQYLAHVMSKRPIRATYKACVCVHLTLWRNFKRVMDEIEMTADQHN